MKILLQNLVEWLGSRLQKMSRHEPADWLQCWDLSGKFCRWSCWETKNWNIIICFLSAAYGGWSEPCRPASAATPSTTPHPNQSQKVTPKNVFSNKVCLEGIQMRVINLRSLPSKFTQRSKKSRNFPKFVKHSSATPWRSRLNRVKSTSVFFMTSTSNPQVQYLLSTAVSVSICVHFILCFSVFRFDENVPYLAFHIPPSKSQCLICGKIFSVWRFL